MKKIFAVFVTVSITLGASAFETTAASYQKDALRWIEGNIDSCAILPGYSDKSNGACYTMSSGRKDKIEFKRIELNGKRIETIEVTTVQPGGGEKSFAGVMRGKVQGGVSFAAIDKNSGRLLKNGCVMSVFVTENQASAVPSGENCDIGLSVMHAKRVQ